MNAARKDPLWARNSRALVTGLRARLRRPRLNLLATARRYATLRHEYEGGRCYQGMGRDSNHDAAGPENNPVIASGSRRPVGRLQTV